MTQFIFKSFLICSLLCMMVACSDSDADVNSGEDHTNTASTNTSTENTTEDNSPECEPDCSGKSCGMSNNCTLGRNIMCGTCDEGLSCSQDYECVAGAQPTIACGDEVCDAGNFNFCCARRDSVSGEWQSQCMNATQDCSDVFGESDFESESINNVLYCDSLDDCDPGETCESELFGDQFLTLCASTELTPSGQATCGGLKEGDTCEHYNTYSGDLDTGMCCNAFNAEFALRCSNYCPDEPL